MRNWLWGRGVAMRSVTLSGLMVLLATQASASTILNYAGLDFTTLSSVSGSPPDLYTLTDSVTGFLELAAPLGANLVGATVVPLSFGFSDGVNTITGADSPTSSVFDFWTDGSGQIVQWNVTLSIFRPLVEGQRTIRTINQLSGPTVFDFVQDGRCGAASTFDGCDQLGPAYYSQAASVRDAPGEWSEASSTIPEPSTLLLLGTGLAAAAARRRNKERR